MPLRMIDTATEALGSTLPLVLMMVFSGTVVSPSITDSVYSGRMAAVATAGASTEREQRQSRRRNRVGKSGVLS